VTAPPGPRPRPRAVLPLVLLGLGLALARPVRAQPVALQPRLVFVSAQARADELFEDAGKDRDAGLIGQAARKYRAALRLWPHPTIHYHLALVLIELDQPVDAAEHLEAAIALGAQEPERQHARQKLDELLARELATVVITCPRPGAQISIDNDHVLTVEKDRLHTGMTRVRRVRIGWHTFAAQMPGDAADVVIRRYVDRSTRPAVIKLEEQWTYRRRWEGRVWAPWTVIGGGVLLGLTGGALQLAASASYQQYERRRDACSSDGRSCDQSGFAYLRDRGDLERTLGIVGYGIAGAAIVTGGVLAYLNRPVGHRIKQARIDGEPRRRQAPRPSAAIEPLVSPDGGGVMVMGRF